MNSDSLIALIFGLNKVEKRYITQYYLNTPKQRLLRQLFQDILQMRPEPTIRKKLQNTGYNTQFHVLKNHLREVIVKGLKQFHRDYSAESRIKEDLRSIEVMFARGQYQFCLNLLKKAKAFAKKYELLIDTLSLLAWERKLHIAHRGVLVSKDILAQLQKEESETLAELQRIHQSWSAITALADRRPYDPPLPTAASSVQGEVITGYAHYLSVMGASQPEAGRDTLSNMVQTLEAHPHLIADSPATYCTTLNNLAAYYMSVNDPVLLQETLEKVRQIPTRYAPHPDKFPLRQLLQTYNIELEYYRLTGDFLNATRIHKIVIDLIEKFQNTFPEDYLILFYFQFADVNFQQGHLVLTLHWLNAIECKRWGDTRQDVQDAAQFLSCWLHYQQENRAVLDSKIRSLQLKKLKNRFEKNMLKFFLELRRSPTKKSTYQEEWGQAILGDKLDPAEQRTYGKLLHFR